MSPTVTQFEPSNTEWLTYIVKDGEDEELQMQRPSTGADIYLAVVYPHCHEAIDFAPGKEENLDRNEWNELWVHDFTDIKYFQPNEDIFFRIHAGRFGRQMLFNEHTAGALIVAGWDRPDRDISQSCDLISEKEENGERVRVFEQTIRAGVTGPYVGSCADCVWHGWQQHCPLRINVTLAENEHGESEEYDDSEDSES